MKNVIRCVSLSLTLLLLLSHFVSSQHYHFSNGWNSGKKRSGGSTPGGEGAGISPCDIRPEFTRFINTLIREELNRIKSSCFNRQTDLDTDSDFTESASNHLPLTNFKLTDRRWK